MSPLHRSFSSDSPVLAMTSPPPPPYMAKPDISSYAHTNPCLESSTTISALMSSPQLGIGNRRTAGRKRSRDEAAPNLNGDEPDPTHIKPIKETEESWVYGEGMVLIKPNQGYVRDASSQSGTWVEEKTAQEDAQRAEEGGMNTQQQHSRPTLRSHKSQRLDQDPIASPGAEIPLAHLLPRYEVSGSTLSTSLAPSEGSSQPMVDDLALHLGIGWRRISDDEHIQAAARGWSRYIENHYPLSSVKITLESRGLQSYLVEAAEGFFLFSENLRQGRLVSTNAGATLDNLKASPPVFDGTETLQAAESPSPTPLQGLPVSTDNSCGSGVDMEMDLS